MKRILVPTDFSINAKHALDYAVCVANYFKSTIELLHAYRVRSQSGMFISVEKHIREDVDNRMTQLLDKTRKDLEEGTEIKPHIIRDDTVHAITSMADELEVELVIMGTQGSSLFREIFLGSIATGVMRRVNKPLIVIPHGTTCKEIHKSVLALDELTLSSDGIFEPLRQISEIRNAEILVFHSESEREFTGFDPRVEKFLNNTKHTYHQIKSDEQVNKALRRFCKDHDADMLCLVHREKSLLDRIFHRSVTEREFFNIDLPLMVLRDAAE